MEMKHGDEILHGDEVLHGRGKAVMHYYTETSIGLLCG
jgi:hypothetical protein